MNHKIKPIPLSPYGAASASPSPVNRMMSAFASHFRPGVDFNLGVGYVDETAVPARRLAQAALDAARTPSRFPNALNYGGPSGSERLIAALKSRLASPEYGAVSASALRRSRFLIGVSGVTSLLEALGEVISPGLVVTADPWYYIYCDYLRRRGFSVETVPEDPEGLDLSALHRLLRGPLRRLSTLRFFYAVTVNNPTGTILSDRRRRQWLEAAAAVSRRLGRPIPVFFDRAYEWLLHDPKVKPPRSPLALDRWNLAYELGSLSKIFSPALRVGYLAGPDRPFLDAVVQKTSDVGFSAPMWSQAVATRLLETEGPHLRKPPESYHRKSSALGLWLKKELGTHLEKTRGGSAGFYFYLTFKNIHTGEGGRFFRFLSRTTGDPRVDGPPGRWKSRVSYLPGKYCVNPQGTMAEEGSRSLRISYGYESLPNLRKAVGLIAEAARYALKAE